MSNIKKITPQIAALYLGQKCDIDTHDGKGPFVGHIYPMDITQIGATITPHLRRLDSITEEECQEVFEIMTGIGWYQGRCKFLWWESNPIYDVATKFHCIGHPAAWLYLLSRGFDLFGLIDAGLAKEVTTQTNEK